MASVTSEEKKMLDASDPSDLDYLIMDLGDSDLELDLESCPASPVLRSSFKKQDIGKNATRSSSTQPCKFSENKNIEKNGGEGKDSLSNTPTGRNRIVQSQPVRGGQPSMLFQNSPAFDCKRSMQLRVQARGRAISPVTCLENAKVKPKSSPILMNNKRKATEKEKNEAGVKSQSKRAKLDKLISKSGNIGESLSDDSDVISLYARDEDYMSLYTNAAKEKREVKLDNTMKRNVVIKTNATAGVDNEKAGKANQKDMRYRISKKNPQNNSQEFQVTKIAKLLEENSRTQTLVAAAKFCKAYMDHHIRRVNRDFVTMTRRLAEMLLNFQEMRHLYRIVRLAIDMQIVLSDQVLCGLIDHLGQSVENGKIAVILKQIREKSICCGKCVHIAANKYLHKKKPKPFPQLNGFSGQNCITYDGINAYKREMRTQNHAHAPGNFNGLTGNPSPENDIPFTPPSAQRNVIDTKTFCRSTINWKKDSIQVQIANKTRTPEIIKDGFGCNVINFQNDKIGRNTAAGDVVKLTNQSSASTVNIPMLGKCFGQIVEAVGTQPVTNMLFCAFADMLAIEQNGQESPDPEQDVCPKLLPFLKSALEVSSEYSLKNKIYLWLSRIGVEVNRRLPPGTTYKMARLMKTMGLMLVPSSLENNNNLMERKVRFQIADKIIGTCLERNDVYLAMEIISEYFTDSNTIDAGPVFAPRLCKMLCKVAELACSTDHFFEAAKCLGMLPAGLGDGTEVALMEQALLGIITACKKLSADDIAICTKMVEQMLARNMVTAIRNIIAKAFCANVVPLFKFLEGKGVYRRPQIAQCPHLIIIPFILSVEEMALVVQRHLTELCEFLMEMNEKIRIDIPMRIVLCKNVGTMQPLRQNEATDFVKIYDEGLKRAYEAVRAVLNPNLRVVSKELHSQRKEFVLKVDVNSVKMWMLANTDYDEGDKRIHR